jgi:hypothetical protein
MHCTGHDGWLLPNYTFADHFGVNAIADRVVNEPAPRQKLSGELAHVFDAHEVRENIMALRRLGMIAKVDRPNSDTNSIRLSVVERFRGHDCKLVVAAEKTNEAPVEPTPRSIAKNLLPDYGTN